MLLAEKLMHSDRVVQQVWLKSMAKVGRNGSMTNKQWGSLYVSVCWLIRKKHNSRLFGLLRLKANELARKAVEEAFLWKKFC